MEAAETFEIVVNVYQITPIQKAAIFQLIVVMLSNGDKICK